MKKRHGILTLIALIALLTTGLGPSYAQGPGTTTVPGQANPVGTALTYQGLLTNGNAPYNGTCDIRFTLYDSLGGGSQVGPVVEKTGVIVTKGLFTVPDLDFGAGVFSGGALWLEVAARCPEGVGNYNILTPRQAVTSAPYSTYSQQTPWSGIAGMPAGFADNVDNETLYSAGTGLILSGTTLLPDTAYLQRRVQPCGDGYAVQEVNEDGSVLCRLVDNTTYAAGPGLILTGTTFLADPTYLQRRVGACGDGYAIQQVNEDGSVVCQNAYYAAGTGLELVSSTFALQPPYRLPQSCAGSEIPKWTGAAWECASDEVGLGTYWNLTGNAGTDPDINYIGTTDGQPLNLQVNGLRALRLEPNAVSPNVIGGYLGNVVTTDAYAATIGGGGSSGNTNRVTDDYGTVSGGLNNQAGDGSGTTFDRAYATVGGGSSNTASGLFAAIPGGEDNIASGAYSFAAGRRAQALHPGAFVWGDSTDADLASTGDNQFVVRANGGVAFTTGASGFTVNGSALQTRVDGTCAAGSSIRVVNPNGTVVCEPDDDTALTPGVGLYLAGTTLSISTTYRLPQGCTGNQIAQWNGTLWTCAADDDTTYSAGTGLALAGTIFSISAAYQLPQSCTADQLPKWNGTAWACASDSNTTYTAGTGLALAGTVFSISSAYQLPQSCTSNQLPKWNGTAWACANDDGGTTYSAGTGLQLTGSTFSILAAYQLPQSCTSGQAPSWNGTNWACATYSTGTHNHWGQTWTGTGTGLTLSGGTLGLSGSGSSTGVYGTTSGSTGRGLFGEATSGSGTTYGVYGQSSSATGYGVYGTNVNGYGVYGTASGAGGYGVYGTSGNATGYGVYGANTAGGIGVYGSSSATAIHGNSTGSGGRGVYGSSSSGAGSGVYGYNSAGGYGVQGNSTGTAVYGSGGTYGLYGNGSSYGVYGSGGSTGVYGTGTSRGVYGTTGTAGAWAGYFTTSAGNGVYAYSSASGGVGLNVADGDVQVAGVKPVIFRRYLTNQESVDYNTGYSTADYTCGIVGFYANTQLDINENNSHSYWFRMYPDSTTNTWDIRVTFSSDDAQTWNIDVLCIRNEMVSTIGYP